MMFPIYNLKINWFNGYLIIDELGSNGEESQLKATLKYLIKRIAQCYIWWEKALVVSIQSQRRLLVHDESL